MVPTGTHLDALLFHHGVGDPGHDRLLVRELASPTSGIMISGTAPPSFTIWLGRFRVRAPAFVISDR
jgi:hypothetical protein